MILAVVCRGGRSFVVVMVDVVVVVVVVFLIVAGVVVAVVSLSGSGLIEQPQIGRKMAKIRRLFKTSNIFFEI